MNLNPDFEQNYYSKTAEGKYQFEQVSIRIMKWIAYRNQFEHEKINYFD